MLEEHMSYAGSLLALCPQRRPIPVEIGIYYAAKSSYSGSRIFGPLPNIAALASRVTPLLNRLFKCLRLPPCLRKREVIADIEPASLTLRVTNIERPKPTASADTHPQAGQETITQFDDFPVAWTNCIQSFRGQRLNMPWHMKLYQKVPKRFQKM
jgi:hypothetical protein